jgi:NADH-quinone oxidoreductase subunit L
MLALVTSDDFVQLFFGWEGVGVSSYLLISFWFKKDSASSAAIKAFIVNRVGDFGLVVAIGLCYYVFHTVNFTEISQIFSQYSGEKFNFFGCDISIITLICIFIFIGCMGKSAQFGLHVWLPDAMEGPTPVSALIHAATMVTAGIFLVARCFYFFDASIEAQSIILVISSITMIFAAISAIFQRDIKKVIAYSTCSQLGYMFVACAVGYYDAGMFHLVTHGFFKALLFLSAGSVIHATHEQDMENIPGGLYKKTPITFILMLIGTLAITGLPPFAGYYSKDAIIEALFSDNRHFGLGGFSYTISIITVFLTSFYSWKLIFKIFFSRNSNLDSSSVHESSLVITGPMFLLSLLSIGGGFILVKFFNILGESSLFWGSSLANKVHSEGHHVSLLIENIPLILSIAGFAVSYYFFMIRKDQGSVLQKISKPLYNLCANKFYIDELYQCLLVKPYFALASASSCFDKSVIDKFGPNGARDVAYCASAKLQKYHHGLLYKYNFWQFIVLTALVLYFILLALNIL